MFFFNRIFIILYNILHIYTYRHILSIIPEELFKRVGSMLKFRTILTLFYLGRSAFMPVLPDIGRRFSSQNAFELLY